ncbi:hypothetical protein PDL71_18080 [Lacibacter sp. MH-610]|uniref:tetratricopeptide repeat protein n=1 Tax=Lacibacter sp. MH-610 TaxID=3020883 RepID=UPI003891AAAE
MTVNTQVEIALDDFFAGVITREKLMQTMVLNNITDAEAVIVEHRQAVELIRRYNLLHQVSNVHIHFAKTAYSKQQQPAPKVIKMSTRAFAMRIAAGFLIILTGYTLFQYSNSSSSKLYETLYNTYAVTETRTNLGEPKSEIVDAYKKADYKAVLLLFDQFVNPGNRELFFAGNAHLEAGDVNKAIELFQLILQRNKLSGELLYQDEAEYYLAMAYLKNKAVQKALPLLEAIEAEPAHTYHNKTDKFTLFKMKWLGHK